MNEAMNDFHVYARKGRLTLLGFGALVFVCLGCLFMVFAPEAGGIETVLLFAIGAVCVLFFGLCLIIYIKKMFDRSPMLTISYEGIRDQATYGAAGLIRWEEIADIQALRMHNQDFLCIFTHDRNLIMNRHTGFQRLLHRMNKGLSPAQAHIPLKMLKCSLDTLFEEINKRAPQPPA
ncbi:STM3941 family protein [Paenibacillus soyae]|uniref:Uncharacterized protein n=1 Tax=Paenibacillus soyae TaxID=2969249 RepID=A0A9X2MVE3_9BACL|nr:STM3941 family protein [Paenibacillus soyae]MCR2806566.1 hypothetical protein [Paenibacillus soyae]